ncbi:hypothetical protein [Xanthobacter sediminis]
MNEAHLFWTVFSAVLAAIMLGGCFFWGLIAYNRHERAGTAGNRESNFILIAVLMPALFLLAGLYTALGGR